jgi:lactobin A/cerein 7B family class IIb bacteriocin
MQELTFEQVEEVNGGIAFLGWVAYGAFQVGMAAGRAALANPRATATAVGLVAGWLSEE